MKKSLAIALPLGLFVSACAASPPPVAAAAPPPPASPAPQAAEAPRSAGIQVAPDILKACGLPDADAYFAFDSAHITTNDISPLNAIVTCFKTGPLEGRSLKLVGRADPRGATEYNMTLGQSRADTVEGYMASRGLDKAKILTTSRGAMDAIGTSEPGWARDRRVDVMLGD